MKNTLLKRVICWALVLAIGVTLLVGVKKSGAYAVYTYATKHRDLPIYSVEGRENQMAISFDCAWGTDYTYKILDALDFYKVKCTFFATQFWVEKYPEVVAEIFKRGHEIGTHSKTHSKMSKMSKEEIEEELSSSREAIEKITGEKVELFRAPYGDYDDLLIQTARDMGLFTVQWDVDSLDWKDLSEEEIANRILKKAKSGSIILCHNNGLHTAESLPLIFSVLIEKGFVFKPIGELIYKNDYTVDRSGRQISNRKT